MNKKFRHHILLMVEELKKVQAREDDIVRETSQRINKKFKKMIDEYGFPTKSLVGEDGHDGAFYLINNALYDVEFMSRIYKEFSKLPKNEINCREYAYLEDKLNYFVRKPQAYGTVFYYDLDGKFKLWKLVDEERVDLLRASVGLDLLEEELDRISKEGYRDIDRDMARKNMKIMEDGLVDMGWLKEKNRLIK